MAHPFQVMGRAPNRIGSWALITLGASIASCGARDAAATSTSSDASAPSPTSTPSPTPALSLAPTPTRPSPLHAPHRFCGWLAPSSSDPALTDAAYDTFAAHAGELDAVHPAWWRVESATRIVNHPRGSDAPYLGFRDPRVLAHTSPGGAATLLVPSVTAVHAAEYVQVHRMINDENLRAQHVRLLVQTAVDEGYDGIDVDYEHLDPQHLGSEMRPGQTRETETRAFVAFIDDLAAALHAEGKVLSVDVPAFLDEGYDYEGLASAADEIHIMAYDFHYEGGPHVGPVAPLAWVQNIAAYAASLDGGRLARKFLLGLPNYGLVGPDEPTAGAPVVECETSRRCADLAAGRYALTTNHMEHCPLAAFYGTPAEAGRSPNAALPSGERVFFEDLGSLEERVEAAQRAGLGGVAEYPLGGEPVDPGQPSFFEMVRRHFPE